MSEQLTQFTALIQFAKYRSILTNVRNLIVCFSFSDNSPPILGSVIQYIFCLMMSATKRTNGILIAVYKITSFAILNAIQ